MYLYCDLLSDFMFLYSEIVGYNDFKQLDDPDPWKDAKLKIRLEKIFQVFGSRVLGVWLEVCKEFAMCKKTQNILPIAELAGRKVAKKFLHK